MKFSRRSWVAGLALTVMGFGFSTGKVPAAGGLELRDDFESGIRPHWQLPFPEDWETLSEAGNAYLHMKRSREPGVPRRPLQFAMLKDAKAGSFEVSLRVRREGRSMIVVFNYVDTLHFYYAHLSGDRGGDSPVHNGLFIVNGEPRKRIAGLEAPPALPDGAWHRVRLVRDAPSGSIEVFVDGAPQPLFSVVDRTFDCGLVGVGSFDETGDFDDIVLRSKDVDCEVAHASCAVGTEGNLARLGSALRGSFKESP